MIGKEVAQALLELPYEHRIICMEDESESPDRISICLSKQIQKRPENLSGLKKMKMDGVYQHPHLELIPL